MLRRPVIDNGGVNDLRTHAADQPVAAPVAQRLRRPALDRAHLEGDLRALVGGGIAVFLMIYWAVDDGGYDPTTWYWGALVALATLAGLLSLTRGAIAALPRALKLALVLFGLYVAWSYLSMSWAAYPGLALEGSNRALLYLLMFAIMAVVPWRRQTALLVIGTFASGIGVIAVALLFRLALGDAVPALFQQGRLITPTGYFNSNSDLFTTGALVAVALAARRGMPGVMRGLMCAFASADLMLAVTVQSRGWLFTLPVVGLYCAIVLAGRLRCVGVALLAAAATLGAVRPMLRLYQIPQPHKLTHAAIDAGRAGLLSCAAVFAVSTLIFWIEAARGRPPVPALARRILGTLTVALAVAALFGGLLVVAGGHPGAFISKQWHGFTRPPSTTNATSYFNQVGSGRYDIWMSALDAFRAHPIGGLGQDNFGDWYLTHRHTREEPAWTHSLELRLLAHTGIVGLLLFAGFLAAALGAALLARRRGGEADRMLVGAALLPLGPWLIHGSIDWFWEFPALTGPALGFLAMAGRLRVAPAIRRVPQSVTMDLPRRRATRAVPVAAGVVTLVAATAVLGLPYLAVRELSLGTAASHTNVGASLADFRESYRLNPLMSDPGTLGGSVALVNGDDAAAAALFRQAVIREPGDWIAWLGRGLAASGQGRVRRARRAFRIAMHLDSDQIAVQNAWRRVGTSHPLTPREAFDQINYLP